MPPRQRRGHTGHARLVARIALVLQLQPLTEGRVQRRLAAILSADVVGYSRLMGLDEAGTLRRALLHEFVLTLPHADAGRVESELRSQAHHSHR